MIEVASLRYGIIFKKAFSQPLIFTAFVKDILEIEIDKVSFKVLFSNAILKLNQFSLNSYHYSIYSCSTKKTHFKM
jgi:hypothetical protein